MAVRAELIMASVVLLVAYAPAVLAFEERKYSVIASMTR
jgi:hypothetical protein